MPVLNTPLLAEFHHSFLAFAAEQIMLLLIDSSFVTN